MSDETIREGDLAIAVKPRLCCPEKTKFGKVVRVLEIHSRRVHCFYCGKPLPKGTIFARTRSGLEGTELCRLRKIPPLTEPESNEEKKELTA